MIAGCKVFDDSYRPRNLLHRSAIDHRDERHEQAVAMGQKLG